MTSRLGLLVLLGLLLSVGRLLSTCLLSNLAFHKINGVLLKLLSDLFLFTIPLALDFVRALTLVLGDLALRLVLDVLRHELEVK